MICGSTPERTTPGLKSNPLSSKSVSMAMPPATCLIVPRSLGLWEEPVMLPYCITIVYTFMVAIAHFFPILRPADLDPIEGCCPQEMVDLFPILRIHTTWTSCGNTISPRVSGVPSPPREMSNLDLEWIIRSLMPTGSSFSLVAIDPTISITIPGSTTRVRVGGLKFIDS